MVRPLPPPASHPSRVTHRATLLAGKVAIVTGGGGGIGRGISEALAISGATVVVAELDPARATETAVAIEREGGRALAVVTDVRRGSDIERLVGTTLAEFEHVDILVNNVGHYVSERGHFHDSLEEEWLQLYEINLLHVFRMCKAVIPPMIERGRGGSIITISSVEAFRSIPAHAVYAAFKAGVANFTRSLAIDLSDFDIRVNDIAPDFTRTIQIPYEEISTPEEVADVRRWVPVGRLGDPADFGGVAVFLASDHSAYVTGTSIHVDGGTYAAGGWYRSTSGPRRWTCRPIDA
jgi:NAD(P)-dependent dehydrogenase (short-subunit alcohol dehydrogenase family)